ncbi:hypothetical protein [Riemerella columbipharyngis]|uniref:Outer membrane protein beta-barrel domain-containing protein n=1 Tax=Riemerella columbipharyngis TaxID=1071918 RepID=A0A1G7B6I0_9FLAO|nr:hypothetical protein [Riemerella columbipharyngis]SDE22738.1 hypothetical protein SAMN05421544_10549 [Riemerella columbipharyngis]
MKKITLIICMICAGICFAQVHIGKFSNPDSKWTYGGYAGVGGVLGNNSETSIYIAPRVGYLVDSNLEAGLSGSLNWFSSKYYNASTLGVGPYAN